jgi:hypothetical protein
MMRTFLPVILLLTVTGCASAVSEGAAKLTLDPLVTAHAAALAGCDLDLMRQTGRNMIATYDAVLAFAACPP